MKRLAVASIAIGFAVTQAHAQTVALACKYEKSLDTETLLSEAISGEFSLQITLLVGQGPKQKASVVSSKGPCFEAIAEVDGAKLHLYCESKIHLSTGPTKVIRNMHLNRVSGAFEEHFGFNKVGLIHSGRCFPVRPLF